MVRAKGKSAREHAETYIWGYSFTTPSGHQHTTGGGDGSRRSKRRRKASY